MTSWRPQAHALCGATEEERRRVTFRTRRKKRDGGNSRKGKRDKKGRVAVDIISQFLYTRFSLSLTNLAALKLFRRGVREVSVRVTF
jgi:hypothetical protein